MPATTHADRVEKKMQGSKRLRRQVYLQRVHELVQGFLHIECGTFEVPGRHHPIEERIAAELEKAFSAGCHAGRRGRSR